MAAFPLKQQPGSRGRTLGDNEICQRGAAGSPDPTERHRSQDSRAGPMAKLISPQH